jgi:hypothetical protein
MSLAEGSLTLHPIRSSGELMPHKEHSGPEESKLEAVTEWLDDKLLPYLGPPALGPYDKSEVDPPEVIAEALCPICGHAMGAHIIETTTNHGTIYLRHPDDSFPELMETGRPRR